MAGGSSGMTTAERPEKRFSRTGWMRTWSAPSPFRITQGNGGTMISRVRTLLLLALFVLLASVPARAGDYSVNDFEGQWSWRMLHTKQIQSAINACSESGGGTVTVPDGFWFTGTLFLKDGVTLHLEEDAMLVAVPHPSLFPAIQTRTKAGSNKISNRALIYAEGRRNIGVTGSGTLQQTGLIDPLVFDRHERPHIIKFADCENVRVAGITLKGAATWTQLYLKCRDVELADLTVYSIYGSGSDDMDIDSCSDVVVSNCDIDSYNDALAIKSTSPTKAQNIRVRGCELRSGKRGLKIGTESVGGFENISIRDCVVEKGRRTLVNPFPRTMRAAMFISTVDGGDIRDLTVSGVRIADAQVPLFLTASKRSRKVEPGQIVNLNIKDIRSDYEFAQPAIISAFEADGIRGFRLSEFLPGAAGPRVVKTDFPQKAMIGKPKFDMYGFDFQPGLIVHNTGLDLR